MREFLDHVITVRDLLYMVAAGFAVLCMTIAGLMLYVRWLEEWRAELEKRRIKLWRWQDSRKGSASVHPPKDRSP